MAEIVPVGPKFVSKYWQVIGDILWKHMKEEENVEPSPARLTALLKGFQTGELTLWVALKADIIVALFVTSKYVGGPGGGWILYLSYLCGIDKIPLSSWKDAIAVLRAHMKEQGCVMLVAHTSDPKIADVASILGAETDTRLMWRL